MAEEVYKVRWTPTADLPESDLGVRHACDRCLGPAAVGVLHDDRGCVYICRDCRVASRAKTHYYGHTSNCFLFAPMLSKRIEEKEKLRAAADKFPAKSDA